MPRQPALLLLGRAVREERRPDEVDADATDELGRAGASELLGDDEVLDRSDAATAVLLGPRHADPAARGELRLPLASERDLVGEVVEAGRQPLAVLPRQVVAQPGAHLVAQARLLGGRGEVHAGGATSGAVSRVRRPARSRGPSGRCRSGAAGRSSSSCPPSSLSSGRSTRGDDPSRRAR